MMGKIVYDADAEWGLALDNHVWSAVCHGKGGREEVLPVGEVHSDLLLGVGMAVSKLVQLLQNSVVPLIVPSVLEGHRAVAQHMQESLVTGAEWTVWCRQLLPQVKVGIVG